MKRLLTIAAVTLAATAAFSFTADAEQSGMMNGDGMGPGLFMPMMDSAAGRQLFASKGCVVCHSINGVGGEDAPALDASTMDMPMSPFEFMARMWRGAPEMIEAQEDELGAQIEFTGQERANIIAFVHDAQAQATFSEDDIPDDMRDMMEHMEEHEHDVEGEGHE